MNNNKNLPLLLIFPDYLEPGKRLSKSANLPYEIVKIHHFPDGESRIVLPEQLPEKVILFQTLDHPNNKLIELILTAATARQLGANQVELVVPYLCYMRQDKAFHPGEAVSQSIIGKLLATHFDTVITVDPHLHRVHDIKQAVPATKSISLYAAEPIAKYISNNITSPFLIGPDEESEQWIASIANPHGFDYLVARKQRSGDREVIVSLPEVNLENRNVVLVDDIASTGRTLIAATNVIIKHNPLNITAIVTHALFTNNAYEEMEMSGINNILSTDSVLHKSNKISLDQLLADAIHSL